jgi:signal peptidase I
VSSAVELGGAAQAVPVPAAAARRHRHGLLQAGQSLLYVVVVALFIITFTVQPFRIPSGSMEPTLLWAIFCW